MTGLNIVGIVTKYKDIYIPSISKRDWETRGGRQNFRTGGDRTKVDSIRASDRAAFLVEAELYASGEIPTKGMEKVVMNEAVKGLEG